jgi:hypothetical protein
MMFPKPVIEVVDQTFGLVASTLSVATEGHHSPNHRAAALQPREIVDWMLINERNHAATQTYLDFLRRARTHFEMVKQKMGYWNPEANHSRGHDRWSIGWAGDNLLSMASCLYVLDSYEVPGCVLECGVFKGSSTACLSWVCHELKRELFAADSFAGLPSGEGHYGAANFHGTLDEVRRNIEQCGCPECVHFVPGLFAESLKNFSHDIAMLWVDVDLQESTLDVMNNVFSCLAEKGIIFSDGFAEGIDFADGKIRFTGGEPAGFFRFFEKNLVDYKIVPGGPNGLALIVPNCKVEHLSLFDSSAFAHLLNRL